MITLSAVPRAAAKWMAIASAIVALGCPPPGGPPSPEWSTPLPTGVDSDAVTFRNRVREFPAPSGNPHTRARAARCSLGSLCVVNVKIEALGNTLLIDPDNVPPMGVAVARIENLDSRDVEAKFGFLPGNRALYYLWVDRRPRSTKARWTILQVPMGAGIVTAGHQKNLNLCNHAYSGEIRMSDADFYEYKYDDHPCDASVSAEKSSLQEASFLSTEQFIALVGRVTAFIRGELTSQGGWISCSGGCCT